MANIRVLRLSVRSSTTLEVEFTTSLDSGIGLENVSVKSAGATVDDLTLKSVSVSGSTLTIIVRPMVPRTLYEMVLESTVSQPFCGSKGETLVEDGATNHIFFTGQEDDNDIRDTILSGVEGQKVYKTENSLIRDAIDVTTKPIIQARRAAGEVRSAKFISVTVENEEMTRGSGPTDRFANEGVFKLLRVGRSISGATESGSLEFTSFPSDPISLRQVLISEEEVSNTINQANRFEGLIVTLTHGPVIQLQELTLVRGNDGYSYDIERYRYGLKESRFDTDNAYPALDLEDSQLRLSSSAIGPTFPFPQGSDMMRVTYLYKKEGRVVESDTVSVTSIVPVTRESVPAVATTFFLDNAPIVDSTGSTVTRNGITWLDPNQNFDPQANHPAFLVELPFSESSLPTNTGEWAVNYSNGRVVVAGVDGTGTDGTTVIPPVASYNYKRSFQEGLDYNYFSDLNEIASVPDRNLDQSTDPMTVSFGYEDTFADDTDFLFASHVEVLNERVKNRIIGTVGIEVLNGPVIDVFRIFNETTGEIYSVSRVSGNKVFFTATNPPRLIDVSRESAKLDSAIQDQIVVTDVLSVSGETFSVFRIELTENKIAAATGDAIGANFNTSLEFSDTSVFIQEMYYDQSDTIQQNLIRLGQVGNYMVDYVLGIAYVAVDPGSSTAIGDASYKYGQIIVGNQHIVSVNNVYRSPSPTVSNVKIFNIGQIGDETVTLSNLEEAGEMFNSSGNAITVITVRGNNAVLPSSTPIRIRSIFQVTDLHVSADPVNFASGSSIQSDGYVFLDSLGSNVVDGGLTVKGGGARKYVEAERLIPIASGSTPLAVLATNPSDSAFLQKYYAVVDEVTGTDYFSFGSDGYVDTSNNRIVLPAAVPSSVIGRSVEGRYRAKLLSGAAIVIDYTPGDIFLDYTYLRDEILISYEYGDNVLDWSISDSLSEGETYYTTYKYGALREPLRDSFGALTSVDELSTIPENLNRETYRAATQGALQSFLKGPTIPSIKQIAKAVTEMDPEITESAFEEWILGHDYLNLIKMKASGIAGSVDPPGFVPGKFEEGILINTAGQTLTVPASSNMRFAEGTWESFIIPQWSGIENDATLTFDLKFDGIRNTNRVFLGSSNMNPEEMPFSISRYDTEVLGRPTALRQWNGYFLWFDTDANKWRLRMRAPISEERQFEGTITTSGQFASMYPAVSIDGYEGEGGSAIDEVNDSLTSTDFRTEFDFVVDGYDLINMTFDSYSSGGFVGYDGIDFISDNMRYLFDTGADQNRNRMSLFKDGKGFIRLKVYDSNGRIKILSTNIKEWDAGSTHHVAASWKIGTVEQRDELHLFVDGQEVPNTYRFLGSFEPSPGSLFMDEAGETLLLSASKPIVGGFDMVTTAGSDIVTSLSHDFISKGVSIGDRIIILDSTDDGAATQFSPFVYVRSVISEHSLRLETGPVGSGTPYLAVSSLTGVKYSVNQSGGEGIGNDLPSGQFGLLTSTDPLIEKIRVFAIPAAANEFELFSPETTNPDYSFERDGYEDFVVVNNGIDLGSGIYLRSYGLTQQRCRQRVYMWPDMKTNLLRTIMPQPTSVSKIKITAITIPRTNIETGAFAIVATLVGGHMIQLLSSNLEFCQPTNRTSGRRLTVTINGNNFDFSGLNEVTFVGSTYDGSGSETLVFSSTGSQTTVKYFTRLTDVVANFTPIDLSKPAGSIEVRERKRITESENGGDAALVRLSVQDDYGYKGSITTGQNRLTDPLSRFGAENVGDIIRFEPPFDFGTYVIEDVLFDPSSTEQDSDTVVLSGNALLWSMDRSNLVWRKYNVSFSDSGFANGLITLEISGSGGSPFYLGSCWYEVDFPAYLIIPWSETPETLYIGSDMNGENQAGAIIDEMRILNEISDDTGNGETVSSSGRSISTDATVVREFETTAQTLALFHFNGNMDNSADFLSSFSQDVFQSENSVNENFGQSVIFNRKDGQLDIDNSAIFQNDAGTIEFWVSPLVDTHNDPTRRYYIDLSTEQTVSGIVLSPLTVRLPSRARDVSTVKVSSFGSDTNYFTGGRLSSDGMIITLGQPLPAGVDNILITFTPITSQGDRFSIFKNENGNLCLFVSAGGTDYQISVPVFWKRNTWHRIHAGWDLNNSDNQDRLVFLVDGSEQGIIRYGTGLLYGMGYSYGMPTVFGSGDIGSAVSRNILADINLTDFFNTVHIGGDFTGQLPALARMDNMRFSNSFRSIKYLGGLGPGSLLGQDLLFTSNLNTAQPVVSDALTTLMLDFDSDVSEVKLAQIRDGATGIFDFFITVFDSFGRLNDDSKDLIEQLMKRLKPAHTRAFVEFIDD